MRISPYLPGGYIFPEDFGGVKFAEQQELNDLLTSSRLEIWYNELCHISQFPSPCSLASFPLIATGGDCDECKDDEYV